MPPHRLVPGTLLHNRYRVRQHLREGGFGIIYLCQDEQLQRRCAVKQNLDSSNEGGAQFLQEARILSGLSHPNLPGVSDLFDDPAGQFFVMDYIAGTNLQEMMDDAGAPFSTEQVLEWLPQMISAVQHLHDQTPHPVIHRDIKPANFILTPTDALYLIDFGIAKVSQPRIPTQAGALGVSEGYSPPEQYTRTGTTPASDQYALAATLYTLLTAVVPPESPLRFAATNPLKPASHFQPMLPPAVDAILVRALSIDPADRYPSVAEFGKAFEQALQSHHGFRLNPKDPASEIHTLKELFDLCDSSRTGWETARKALSSGRMAACLKYLGSDTAIINQAKHPDPDQWLERLLRRLGRPRAEAQVDFGRAQVFPKLRNGENVAVLLTNTNSSGLVSGTLQPIVDWIEIPLPRFSLLPGEQVQIQVRILPVAFAASLERNLQTGTLPDPFVIVRD
ncbi:MAG: serine/threonine protein kinase [Anaerolineae bacterium]|nr:serine/threonine protein kinase [Anaerolineae bacterium]